jgi:HlyD family secretion protein
MHRVGMTLASLPVMDILRPEQKRRKRIRRIAFALAGTLVAGAVTAGLARLQPAAPRVQRSSLWIEPVQRGEMLRQVSGTGTLEPRQIRWVPAQTAGRVEQIDVQPGAVVKPDTVLVEMSNPDLMQKTEAARFALKAEQAKLAALKPKLQSQRLDQRAALASADADYESAKLEAEADKPLVKDGIVSAIDYKRAELSAQQLKTRLQIEKERVGQFAAAMKAQIAAQQAQVEQARNTYERRQAQVASLHVRAGLAGVLQQVQVEVGQRVELGANIARVARPDDLKAQLHVAETQARDVQIGQPVSVDTHNGTVAGVVSRIDPAVQGGTVEVDVRLTGKLPEGARPDLSVDGTIQIERLEHVLYTGRPAYGQPDSTISLFKVVDGGRYAVKVPVKLGRTSVNTVEILQGLKPGDKVVLSDTSAWDDDDRIRLD